MQTGTEHDPDTGKAREAERHSIVNRLRRLEGQVRGVQTMIQGEKECEAVLTQLLAAKSALDRVGMHIIGFSMKECLARGDDPGRDELIGDAFEVFTRFRRLSRSEPEASGIALSNVGELGARLTRLEGYLGEIRELIECGAPCEEAMRVLSTASSAIDDVGLGILGHSMKTCLLAESSGSQEELIDDAIAIFLKYSNCVK